MTEFSPAGLALLKSFEVCILHTYDDADQRHLPIHLGDSWKGTLTIGRGHTGAEAKPGATITPEGADALQRADLAVRCASVGRLLTRALTANQFSCLVDFAFNVGLLAFAGSSALHLANMGTLGLVPDHIALWNKVHEGGQLVVSPGLVSRRAAECALWALPDNAPILDFKAIGDAAAKAWRAGA